MDSVTRPQLLEKQATKTSAHCLLCFAKTELDRGSLIAIRGEEGIRRNIEALIRKYFAEENIEIDGYICSNCSQQLGNFHQFYLKIKEIQWNQKMKTSGKNSPNSLAEGFEMEMSIKEEKIEDNYSFDQTAEVDGLNNFLDEQLGSQSDQNGNGTVQNRLLDSIVNEFQASSLNNDQSGGSNANQPYPKRIKRNFTEYWQPHNPDSRLLSNTTHSELDLLDEEFCEYDKPPDERSHQSALTGSAALDEMERLRRENEWLKRRNHLLLTRLRDVHVRNNDLLQINRELTTKLRSYDPNALAKPIPSGSEHPKIFPSAVAQVNQKPQTVSPSLIPASLPTVPAVSSQEYDSNKYISLSGAYSLDNGDVVVMDSVIPYRTMLDIDAIEPGEKFDLKFVSKLAIALWGHERLAVSSVTGRKSNNAGHNAPPSIQLEPEKLSFIKEKVYNRAIMETNDRVQAMARFDDSRINRLLNIKIQNAKRKKTLNFSPV
ncbi:uncharacterized protein LOC131437915 [Malaya genurostris]|uniref:uncharacterized protein LOC131437915 n=1 Tax=Malaya genurostris TaxID=325434 RepID=UPI0026F389F8|nr:uncharacterized protein LOC131437915 [Malaya genurostris]